MNIRLAAAVLTAVFVLPAFALSRPPVSPRFQVTDLGALPGQPFSQAIACNNRGMVTGICWGGDRRPSAFVWQAGRMRALPVLTGSDFLSPRAINNRGQIVGTAYGKIAWKQKRAFLWEHGTTRDLGTPAAEVSEAFSINDRGEVVGTSYRTVIRNGVEHHVVDAYAFIWSKKNGFRKLGKPWADSSPSVINNSEQMTGSSFMLGLEEEKKRRAALPPNQQPYRGNLVPTGALLWKNGAMHNLEILPAWSSVGIDINDQAEIVGRMSLYPDSDQIVGVPAAVARARAAMRDSHHWFLWRNGQTLDLGSAPDAASIAINNQGDIVGGTRLTNSDKPQAFLWRDGQRYILSHCIPDSAGWHLSTATGINNHRQIVGNGLHNGQRRAFLLTAQ